MQFTNSPKAAVVDLAQLDHSIEWSSAREVLLSAGPDQTPHTNPPSRPLWLLHSYHWTSLSWLTARSTRCRLLQGIYFHLDSFSNRTNEIAGRFESSVVVRVVPIPGDEHCL